MSAKNFDEQIREDLDMFLSLKSKTSLQIDDIIQIGAFVGANFLRMLFSQQKDVSNQQLNSIFGVISNHYHDLFGDQLQENDYHQLSDKALKELQDVNFEQNMHDYFDKIVQEANIK
ncbi:MAG TPA: hypothetical protein VKY32_08525 [Flavobacterium sp.]|nr:hypothetical protein [Flavobacterium sp.]